MRGKHYYPARHYARHRPSRLIAVIFAAMLVLWPFALLAGAVLGGVR